MQILQDTIEINVKPAEIFQWFKDLDKYYEEWHPDHVSCQKLTSTDDLSIGDIFCYEEYLHGELHKLKFKLINLKENKFIEFKTQFPFSMICPGGSFLIEPIAEKSLFTATLSFRVGKLLSKLLKSRVEAFKLHMKEEGENLKKLLEEKK